MLVAEFLTGDKLGRDFLSLLIRSVIKDSREPLQLLDKVSRQPAGQTATFHAAQQGANPSILWPT